MRLQLLLLAIYVVTSIVWSQECNELATLNSPLDRPTFAHLTSPVSGLVHEDDGANTEIVAVFAVGYAHCQNRVRYSLHDIAGQSVATRYFYFSSDSDGVIRKMTPNSLQVYRYDTFQMEVRAYYEDVDASRYSSITVEIFIQQTNHRPTFPADTNNPTSLTVQEDRAKGFFIHRFSATDDNDGPEGRFDYRLIQTAPHQDEGGGQDFSINVHTGDLIISRPYPLISGDVFRFELYADDYGNPSLSSVAHTFTVSVLPEDRKYPIFLQDNWNDVTPEIADTAPDIVCDGSNFFMNGIYITAVHAVDGNTFSEGHIQYAVAQPTQYSSNLVTFYILNNLTHLSEHGKIYMCGHPNRELQSSYIFSVTADDLDSSLENTTTVYLDISDVNEAPSFLKSHYYGEIHEYGEQDAVVVDYLEATDPDIGSNAVLRYSIDSITGFDIYKNGASKDGHFTIEEDTGIIRDNFDLRGDADEDHTLRNYRIQVRVMDSGSLSDVTIVYLTILDINDNEAYFTEVRYDVYLCENQPGTDALFTFQANDWDLTNAGTLNFAIFGVQSERFLINNVRTVYPRPNSRQLVENFGTVNSISAFDYETDSLIEVQLTATDEDTVMTLSSSASVRVFICDDNDLAPYFETDFYSKSITEAHTVMSSLLSIRVFDDDTPINNVTQLTVSPNSLFDVQSTHDPQLFDLLLVTPLDRETPQPECHLLTVTASNHAGAGDSRCIGTAGQMCQGMSLFATTMVEVCVEDVNEHCPRFLSGSYVGSVDENDPHGTLTGVTVVASDGDATAPNNQFRFFIVAGNNDHVLAVDQVTGVVTIDNSPDYERATSHTMTVGVYDLGNKGPGYEDCDTVPLSEAEVTVNVANLNDETPVCPDCPFRRDTCLYENSPAGTFVATVSVTDPDNLAPPTFTLTNELDKFAIDSASGTVTVNGALDYETQQNHNLLITATDGVHTIDLHLIVTICDSNDLCPLFNDDIPHNATVKECPNGNAGGYVTTVIAIDGDTDVNVNTVYAIESITPPGPFVIGRQTGEIHISTLGVDVDTGTVAYTLNISAEDPLSDTPCHNEIMIVVTVLDCNDNTPVVVGTPVHSALCENAAIGSTAATVSFADNDLTTENNEFTVEILSGTNGPLQLGVQPFRLNEIASGQYAIETNAVLDRELPGTFWDADCNALYYLTLRAADTGDPPLTSDFMITLEVCDLNDVCPSFVPAPPTDGYMRTIAEHSPMGTEVISLAAFDPDCGANNDIFWGLTSISGRDCFEVNNGIVRTTCDFIDGAETCHESEITISNHPTPCGTTESVRLTTCISDINNNCPIFAVNQVATSVQENEDASAADVRIAEITVTDADNNQDNAELTLSIVNPSGVSTDPFPFYLTSLGPEYGTLTSDLMLRHPTDYENVNNFNILLVASDRVLTGQSCEQHSIIEVNLENVIDEEPILSDSHYIGYVTEGMNSAPVNMDPGITASDLDRAYTAGFDSLSFSLQALSGDPAPPFSLATGDNGFGLWHITLQSSQALDYEAIPSYQFEVVVMDTASLSDTATVTIFVLDINDNSPEVNQAYLIGTGYPVDMRDSLPLIKTVVCENASVDQRVLDLAFHDVFSDRDDGDNGEIYYDVQHYDPGSVSTLPEEFMDDFGIRQSDLLVVTQPLDYEGLLPLSLEIYHLQVIARDRGSPQNTGILLVDIEVCDSNDHTPEFTLRVSTVEPCEETAGILSTLTACDLDFGSNRLVDFIIQDVEPLEYRNLFELQNMVSPLDVHCSTVDLYTPGLDREAEDRYLVYVQAIDRGVPHLTGTATITVLPRDQNDYFPVWDQPYPNNPPTEPPITVELNEEFPVFQVIEEFTATDRDFGQNSELTYVISSVTPADYMGRFEIDSVSGELRVVPMTIDSIADRSLDYETEPALSYTIEVTVSDNGPFPTDCDDGNSPKSATATIVVELDNINDNIPICIDNYYVCIDEQTPLALNIPLSVFGCQDADEMRDLAPGTSMLTYEIADLVDKQHFAVDNTNEAIVLAPSAHTLMDRETDDEHRFVLTVGDSGYPNAVPVLTTTITVTVCLNDINDNVPMFINPPDPNECIDFSENIAGQDVFTISVFDHDIGANGALTFDLSTISGTPATFAVRIVEMTTVDDGSTLYQVHIHTLAILDRESIGEHHLELTARDGSPCLAGVPSADLCSATISFCVNLVDINDNRPSIEAHIAFCVNESVVPSSQVHQLSAMDADIGVNAIIHYNLIEGAFEVPFDIEPETGIIRTAARLDRETIDFYNFTVRVTDQATASLVEYITVSICILDAPDSVPMLPIVIVNATENRTGEVIGRLEPEDPDLIKLPIYCYIVDFSSEKDVLSLNNETWEITVVKLLDREIKDQYNLTVGCTKDPIFYMNSPLNSKMVYSKLYIQVLDVNDNAPQFEQPFYIFAIDHKLEYGEGFGSVFANDVDLGLNATVRYEFVEGYPYADYHPYFTVNETTGILYTAGSFVDRIGWRIELSMRGYDNLKIGPEQNNDGWRRSEVPITIYVAEDERRILVTVENPLQDFVADPLKETCARNVLEAVTSHMVYVDRIRHASSDEYYDVSVENSDIVIHAVHPGTKEVIYALDLLNLLESSYSTLNSLLSQECGIGLIGVRLIPSVPDQTQVFIGLIVGVVLGGFCLLCLCLLCGCLCCWERRRRRTYQKKIAGLSTLDKFSHSFYATKNPLFVPALGEAASETSLASGSIVDKENIIYASQELEVPLDEDLGEDDDWLKMDQPPDWLKPEEPEDYDEWTPPPKEPLVPPPLEESETEVEEQIVEEPVHMVIEEKTVTRHRSQKKQKEEVKEEKQTAPEVTMFKRKPRAKPKVYDEQETTLEIFGDQFDSDGFDSDGDLKMSHPPSELMSDEDVEIEADTFANDMFQSTFTSGDVTFGNETTLLLKK